MSASSLQMNLHVALRRPDKNENQPRRKARKHLRALRLFVADSSGAFAGIKFVLTCECKNSIIFRSFSGASLTAPISMTERESK
jgi:hypothetical protein